MFKGMFLQCYLLNFLAKTGRGGGGGGREDKEERRKKISI
jgi:hypothetical protein